MSIRQIAEETGLPKTTVARDLAQVSHVGHLPETVTGSDGKTYAATRPTPQT
ncbi:DNA-binding response regulator, partial [Micromonospora sp. S4605]